MDKKNRECNRNEKKNLATLVALTNVNYLMHETRWYINSFEVEYLKQSLCNVFFLFLYNKIMDSLYMLRVTQKILETHIDPKATLKLIKIKNNIMAKSYPKRLKRNIQKGF